jgi:hypothetical protein
MARRPYGGKQFRSLGDHRKTLNAAQAPKRYTLILAVFFSNSSVRLGVQVFSEPSTGDKSIAHEPKKKEGDLSPSYQSDA